MDDQDSPSSALMIGLIVGGGVVLLLVLVMVFGASFFWLMPDERAFAPVGAPEVVVREEAAHEHPMGAAGEAPAAPPAAPAPAGKGRERLVGTWEAKTLDGGQATLQFLADGTLQSATRPDKGDMLKTQGRWDVVEEAGDRLKLRRTAADNTDSVQDIRFDGPDRFVIEGPGGATYTRTAK